MRDGLIKCRECECGCYIETNDPYMIDAWNEWHEDGAFLAGKYHKPTVRTFDEPSEEGKMAVDLIERVRAKKAYESKPHSQSEAIRQSVQRGEGVPDFGRTAHEREQSGSGPTNAHDGGHGLPKAYLCKRGVDACMCEPPCYPDGVLRQGGEMIELVAVVVGVAVLAVLDVRIWLLERSLPYARFSHQEEEKK